VLGVPSVHRLQNFRAVRSTACIEITVLHSAQPCVLDHPGERTDRPLVPARVDDRRLVDGRDELEDHRREESFGREVRVSAPRNPDDQRDPRRYMRAVGQPRELYGR
jgi:hypothetical protein